jgi:hypothetical protein
MPADGNITANFDRTMDTNTINSTTFKLKKKGSRKVVRAAVTYDANEGVATLNPSSDLKPNATYTAFIVGGAKGVKDSSGAKLRGTSDLTTKLKEGKVFWTFRTFPP